MRVIRKDSEDADDTVDTHGQARSTKYQAKAERRIL